MTTKEKWLCRRPWQTGSFELKQVFVTESEHYFTVQGIQDGNTNTLLGHRKRIPKRENLLFDNAQEAIRAAIKSTENKIATAHATIIAETAILRELDILLRPR